MPIIFDFDHLAKLLGRTPVYLASVVNSSQNHYREFTIPKRSGGVRSIHAPYPALLECQEWILKNILQKSRIHPCAHGFVAKRSIITNATTHLGAATFLKIDIADFFPSIKISRLIHYFKSLGYNNRVSFYLAAICSLDDCLPQGAPTSPTLCNIVARPLDWRLTNLCQKFKISYTRYADDLAFSGEKITWKFAEYVIHILNECGFEPNTKKTQLHIDARKRILTGISILGNEARVPKDYKRRLRQEIFYIEKFGVHNHMNSKRIKDASYLERLIGRIQFVLSVEPENQFFVQKKSSMLKMYVEGRDKLDSSIESKSNFPIA